MRRWPLALAPIFLLGCPKLQESSVAALTSFKVEVTGVYTRAGTTRTPLAVVNRCAVEHGGQALVPAALRGTKACKLIIPRGEIELDVTAVALDATGQPNPTFDTSVSFRVVPGDLSGDVDGRWATADAGLVSATVQAVHQYGEVRVWVQDAPPQPIFDGGVAITGRPPVEPARRTFAAGASRVLYFEEQTLQSLQMPDGMDNKSSPFVGDFVAVGASPESGELLAQSCPDDPDRDGKPAMMVVTGLDPSGFFVTDLSACRWVDPTADSHQTPEPPERCLVWGADGGAFELEPDAGVGTCEISKKACHAPTECRRYLPGTYASIFVYNYNYPDGLFQGDLLFTLSGSIQEFTSTTQMTFPAWSVAEHVHTLPASQWAKWLSLVPLTRVTYRTCGMDDVAEPYLTDQLCGHSKRNLKMESLESALVQIKNARLPTELANCDFNGDGTVPFFCEQPDSSGTYVWGSCAFGEVEPNIDRQERECHQACALGTGPHAGRVCSEAATFESFGQYVVELGMPGFASAGLDDSIPQRFQLVSVPALPLDGGAGSPVRVSGFSPKDEVAIACTGDVRYRAAAPTQDVEPGDPVLPANTALPLALGDRQTSVALLSTGEALRCSVGLNVHSRINVITKDAVPQLTVDCRVDDADAERAAQCRALRGATFDITGHLRHIQPARPRWAIVPRSPDDLCCHPGPGLTCPKPIQICQ